MRVSSMLVLWAVGWSLPSCVSSFDHYSSARHQITQSALVPAPTPMYADAPLAPVGRVSVEGGVTLAQAGTGRQDRRGGAGGHVVPGTTVRARIAWRALPQLEVAFAGEGSGGARATPYARDVSAVRFDYTEAFRVGPQLRVVFNPASRLRVGLSSAILFGRIPWQRDVASEYTSSTYDPATGAVVGSGGASSASSRDDASLFSWANLALFVTGDLGRLASLLGGVSAQGEPAAFGYRETGESCYTPAGMLFASCNRSGPAPDDLPVVRTAFVSTAFVSGELRLGRASLIGRLHAVIAGPDEVTAPGRLGGGLDLRVSFGP